MSHSPADPPPGGSEEIPVADNSGCYGLLFVISGTVVVIGTIIFAALVVVVGSNLSLALGSLARSLLWLGLLAAGGLALALLGLRMRRDR